MVALLVATYFFISSMEGIDGPISCSDQVIDVKQLREISYALEYSIIFFIHKYGSSGVSSTRKPDI